MLIYVVCSTSLWISLLSSLSLSRLISTAIYLLRSLFAKIMRLPLEAPSSTTLRKSSQRGLMDTTSTERAELKAMQILVQSDSFHLQKIALLIQVRGSVAMGCTRRFAREQRDQNPHCITEPQTSKHCMSLCMPVFTKVRCGRRMHTCLDLSAQKPGVQFIIDRCLERTSASTAACCMASLADRVSVGRATCHCHREL